MWNRLVAVIAGLVAFVMLLVVGLVVMIAGGAVSCARDVVATTFTSFLTKPVQVANWKLVNEIGTKLGATPRERAVALAVIQQESSSENVAFGDRDSLGLFQQRPSVKGADGRPYWGTAEQVMDPEYATHRFYEELFKVKNRENMSPLELALEIQRPSYEAYTSDGHSFNNWVGGAVSFVTSVAQGINPVLGLLPSVPTREQVDKANDQASLCMLATEGLINSLKSVIPGLSNTGPGELGMPVEAQVSSGYGMRFHPIKKRWQLHAGMDFAAPGGTPVYAAADGTVSRVEFRSGAGNVIHVEHGGGLETRYAHLSGFADGITPDVEVNRGQLIGYVGSTGLSTGNHLHFEVHKNRVPVDPMPYLRE